MLVPARFAIAMVDDGWWLRNDCIWTKPNVKPESVTDRFVTDYEHVFMFAKSPRYFFDWVAVAEPHKTTQADQKRHKKLDRGQQGSALASAGGQRGSPARDSYGGLGFGEGGRRCRTTWSFTTKSFKGVHFATFPEELPERCLRAGASQGGCCSKCGTPRVRVTVEGEPDRDWQAACGGDADGRCNGQATKSYAAAGAEDASAVKARILEGMRPKHTLGFAFACSCWGAPTRTKFPRARRERKRHQREVSGNHQRRVERHLTAPEGTTRPCRVCDPFSGSGTTLAVAHKLGLDAVGIELQANYAQLAAERVAKAGGVLEVIGLDPPAIRDLLAAAAERPTLPQEAEWEREEPIDEGPGWIDDEPVPAFSWADKS